MFAMCHVKKSIFNFKHFLSDEPRDFNHPLNKALFLSHYWLAALEEAVHIATWMSPHLGLTVTSEITLDIEWVLPEHRWGRNWMMPSFIKQHVFSFIIRILHFNEIKFWVFNVHLHVFQSQKGLFSCSKELQFLNASRECLSFLGVKACGAF